MSEETFDITAAAKRLRMPRRDAIEYLHMLHKKHGGLLFKKTAAPNGKLWVSLEKLKTIRPDLFGGAATNEDLVGLKRRLEAAEAKVAELSAEVADFRRRSLKWYRDRQDRTP